MFFLILSLLNLILSGYVLLSGNIGRNTPQVSEKIGKVMLFIYNGGEVLLKMFNEEFFGSSKTIRAKLTQIYGDKNIENLIHKKQLNTATSYLLIFICFNFLLLAASAESAFNSKIITFVQRPGFGEGGKIIESRVTVNYFNDSYSSNAVLKVKPRELTQAQKEKLLSITSAKLPQLILGNNKDLNHINSPLNLITIDKETGVSIEWTSENPEIISSDGFVDALSADRETRVELTALLSIKEVKSQKVISVKVLNNPDNKYMEALIHGKISKIIDSINTSKGTENIMLPQKIEPGMTVEWRINAENKGFTIIVSAIVFLAAVFFGRYNSVEKQIKKQKELIKKDFPDFINKLVLLLNAGLVVSSAISRIVTDYKNYASIKNEKALYEELYEINRKVKESNASMTAELKNFAQRSGVKEVMRFASIVAENINKGSILAEKLEAEGAILWKSRKGRAEELGKLAETKLTFPLVILLGVLVMIIISPALMEM